METESVIYFGGPLKALDESGKVGGQLVRVTNPSDRDLTGEWFSAKTYYGPRDGDGADVIFHHGIPLKKGWEKYASHVFTNPVKTKRNELGLWAETVLNLADEYEKTVYQLVKAGKLGWSSGSTARLVRKTVDGEIIRWPIVEASLTYAPAEPRNRTASIKSVEWLQEIGDIDEIKSEEVGTDDEFFQPIAPEIKAEWTTAYINDLPDSSFAYVEPGGTKDGDGKTVPRSLRHFPYKDSDGKLDEAHVKNALARIPQSNVSDEAKSKALAIIRRAAKTLGIEVQSGKSLTFTEHFLSVVTAVEEHTKTAGALVEDVTTMTERIRDRLEFRETKDGRTLAVAHRERLTEATTNLATLIDLLTGIKGSFDELAEASKPKAKSDPNAGNVLAIEAGLAEAARFEEMQFNLATRR